MMPIPRELFDEGLDALDAKIVAILNDDPRNAYTYADLADKLEFDVFDFVGRVTLQSRLTDLVNNGRILANHIHNETYYASTSQAAE